MTRIPLNTTKAGATPSCRDILFNTDIHFDDFFDRICAIMEIERQSASIGWKFTMDRRTDPSHQLATAYDLACAFQRAVDLMKNKRIKKAVVLEVVNLVTRLTLLSPIIFLIDFPP